jgi:hypothetical protein
MVTQQFQCVGHMVWAFQIRRASPGIVAHSLSSDPGSHLTWPYSVFPKSPLLQQVHPRNCYHLRSRQIRRELSQPSGTTTIGGFVKVFKDYIVSSTVWGIGSLDAALS